jgi:hypothetical protein
MFAVEKKGEKEGVIPIGNVRKAMVYASPSASTIYPAYPPRIS